MDHDHRHQNLSSGEPRSSTRFRAGTLIRCFQDDATTFDAAEHGTINSRGIIDDRVSEHMFTSLAATGVQRISFESPEHPRGGLVRQVKIIPIKVIVREMSRQASFSRRPGHEGRGAAPRTIIRISLQDDALRDPMIADVRVACFGSRAQDGVNNIADIAIRVNNFLSDHLSLRSMRSADRLQLKLSRTSNSGDPRARLRRRGRAQTACGCRTSRPTEKLDPVPLPSGLRRRRGKLSKKSHSGSASCSKEAPRAQPRTARAGSAGGSVSITSKSITYAFELERSFGSTRDLRLRRADDRENVNRFGVVP